MVFVEERTPKWWRGPPLTFPSGRSLPPDSWARRHRGILVLLGLHAVGLVAFGLYMGVRWEHALLEGGLIGALSLAASIPSLGRRAKSVLAAMGLMSCSGVLVHLSGGYIEAHFHFFVMLGVIFLYEDWLPYVLAVLYVGLHHGIMGTLDPLTVYNHPSAIAQPWRWATIHAVFIFGLSAALIVAWNVIERARISETRALSEAQDLKRRLHTQEKMAAIGALVAGLAHEVRTPLTVVGTSASLLEIAAKREPDNPLATRVLAQSAAIHDNVERINALVLQLRRFHALGPDERKLATLDAVVADAVRLFASAHRAERAIRIELAPTPEVRLHPLGVQQVVLNLMTNAAEATEPLTGFVAVRTYAEASHAVLAVEDNGAGMSEETLGKAFDPLFTTKREGMGLGLHIVKRIADAHNAEIRCESRPGAGTRFEVRFAVASTPREIHVAPAPAENAYALAGGRWSAGSSSGPK